jgi:hypothetical protein
MATAETALKETLDSRLAAYKAAMDAWKVSIQEEENFATPDHSMTEWEAWDAAGFREAELRDRAKAARVLYVDALRQKLFNF